MANVQELSQLAQKQISSNDVHSANNTLKQLATLLPEDISVLMQLAWTYISMGDLKNTISVCEKVLSLNPKVIDANYFLGLAYGQIGEIKKVRQYFLRVLDLNPNHVPSLIKLAYSDYIEGSVESTLSLLLRAKKIEPNNVELNIRFGRLYTAMDELEKAKKHYNLALKFSPENTEAIGQLAALFAYSGDSEKALSLLQPYLDKSNQDLSIIIVLAEICRSVNRCDEAKEYLEEILKSDLDHLGRSSALFALGKIYDRNKDFDKAFTAYREGNDLNDFSFDLWEERQAVKALKEIIDKDFIKQLPRAKKLGKALRPIFIVGMPRSGTSLVEQILSSHHIVHGAGERMEISMIASSLKADLTSSKQYPFCLSEITSSQLTSYAKRYLKDVSRRAPDNAKFITDKMPDNYRHLALIYQMFPKAKVIHCIRDPQDNCLSCYFTQLMGHAYSYDLKTLGAHYGMYKAVMNHWHQVLPLPILDVHYEDMVADTELISKKIIEFCGLGWDDNCLNFYKNKRSVVTASSDQVRQPIYTKSVARWKNYEPYIAELTEALKRTI